MKKEFVFVGVLILIVIQTYPAMGALVEVSVTTDKPSYLLGEKVVVSITAFNPNDYEVYLYPGNPPWPLSYIVDNVFNYTDGMVYLLLVYPPVGIAPFNSLTCNLEHYVSPNYTGGPYYPLEVGVHSVIGVAYKTIDQYIQSEPIQFTVVPEPATVLLLGLGSLTLLRKRRV